MSLILIQAGCALPLSAMSATSWTDHVHVVLARAGLKRGGARDQVIELLASQPCALTAVEIEHALRTRGRAPGRASIYRVLDLLVDYDLVERVELGDGQARFEPVHPSGVHHHHHLCEQCGQVMAFDDPGLERAIDTLSRRLRVHVTGHEVLLRGVCSRCA